MDRAEAAENARREVDEMLAEIRQEAAQREAEEAASANADHAPGDATLVADEHPLEPRSTEDVRAGSSRSKATPGTGLSVSSHEEQVSRKNLNQLREILLQSKVLPGESQEYADAFVHCLLHDLGPRDSREMILACRFVMNAWELRRLGRFKDELRRGAATQRGCYAGLRQGDGRAL
jgi:hypothetical protein